MALTDQAPYAPAASMIKVFEKYRETGLGGGPITLDVIHRMGFNGEIARRIMQTLRLLDYIGDDGQPTRDFVAFGQAPSSTYRQLLGEHLREVYAPVFAVVGQDLSGTDTTEIEDAFRTFKPGSIRPRMVTLFLGLCEYAGIVDRAPTRKSLPGRPSSSVRPPGGLTPRPAPKPKPKPIIIPTSTTGDTTTVQLGSGGVVTLTVAVNLIELNKRDRDFVLDLIDRVKSYGGTRELLPGQEEE